MATLKMKVLLIEDNEGDALFSREMIDATGHTYLNMQFDVEHFFKLSDGLARLEKNAADVILLNFGRSPCHGLDSLNRVLETTHGLPVIVLSGIDDEHLDFQAVKPGAQDFLAKGQIATATLSRMIQYVSERAKSTKTLKEYDEQFHRVVTKSVDAIFIISLEGIILFANPASEFMFKKKPEDLIGTQFGLPISMEKTYEVDIRSGRKDQGVAEIRAVEIGWEGRTCRLLTIRDITNRVKMENELKAAYDKLLEQQTAMVEEERLKVLLQMAGATAHELNQPLMILLNSIELIKTQTDIDSKGLERINMAGQKIATIVSKMQEIRHDEVMPYPRSSPIIKIDQPITILSVEDPAEDYEQLQTFLKEIKDIRLIRVTSQNEALHRIETKSVDIIFLDYMLKDGTGLEFMKLLKEKRIEIPVVFITGFGDELVASQSIQAGAYDYLPKSHMTAASLVRIINNTMEKSRFKHEMIKMSEKMAQMATQDELTGLYNRRFFNESLTQEILRAERYQKELVLAIFDLDHFKNINDKYGHLTGDYVLKKVAKLISNEIRKCDIACRYGGEEMAVIIPEVSLENSLIMCERIREKVSGLSLAFEGKSFCITISAGVASYHKCLGQGADIFIKTVDRLLYQAKNSGRNKVCCHGVA